MERMVSMVQKEEKDKEIMGQGEKEVNSMEMEVVVEDSQEEEVEVDGVVEGVEANADQKDAG